MYSGHIVLHLAYEYKFAVCTFAFLTWKVGAPSCFISSFKVVKDSFQLEIIKDALSSVSLLKIFFSMGLSSNFSSCKALQLMDKVIKSCEVTYLLELRFKLFKFFKRPSSTKNLKIVKSLEKSFSFLWSFQPLQGHIQHFQRQNLTVEFSIW